MHIYIATIATIAIFSLNLYGQESGAANYIEGNPRPRTSNGMLAPFRTQYVDPSIINNIFNLNTGDEFSIQIFENLFTLIINEKNTTYAPRVSITGYKKDANSFFFDGNKYTETGSMELCCVDEVNKTVYTYSNDSSSFQEWAYSDIFLKCP
jgi:hypothetical protein